MRKSVVAGAVVVVAAGAWAGAPYVSGVWAEEAFRDNLKALSGNPQMDVQLKDYHRGWRHATADSRLTVHTPEKDFTFRLHHEIEHGPSFSLPALARVTTTPTVAEDQAKTVSYYFGDRAPLKLEVRIGFSGAQHMTLSSPAYHGPLHSDESVRLDWQGLSGTAELSAGHDRVRLALQAPGLKVAGDKGKVALKGLSAHSRMHKEAEDLWLGESHMALERLSLDAPNPEEGGRIRTTVENISGDQTIAEGEAKDLLNLSGGWGFERATVDGRSFTDGALAMEFDRIDRGAYRELQSRARELQSRGLDPEALNQENLALFQDLAPRFLGRSPALKISRLSVETEDGRLQATAEARYRGDPDQEQLPASAAAMLQRLTAHAKLTVAKELLATLLHATVEKSLMAKKGMDPERARQMAPQVVQMRLGMLQGMGILKAEDDHYRAEATWKEGAVTVNGRPLGMGGGPGAGAPAMPGGGAPATP